MEQIPYPKIKDELRNILEPKCKRCPHHLISKRNRISWGYGHLHSKIMFIIEAPARGDENDKPWQGSNFTGVPLTNRNSGIKFRIQIKKMGFDLSNDFYVTNTVKCFTPGLTPEEKIKVKNNCIVHLMQEIEMIQPELIVCVGGTALEAIYDQILKKKPPGVKISIEGGAKKVDGYHVATMLHPSWYDYWSRKWEWTEKNYLNDSRSILLQYSKK